MLLVKKGIFPSVTVSVSFMLSLQFICSKCDLCHFENYKANCASSINSLPVNITVYFNICHEPIDVTFLIKSKNQTFNWRHTFVTTNIAETKSFEEFQQNIELHVVLNHNDPKQVVIKADFHVDSARGQFIVDEAVQVGDKSVCVHEGDRKFIYQLVSVMAIAIILTLATTTCCIYTERKKTTEHLMLTENEIIAGIPGSYPYQEGAVASRSMSIMKFFSRKFHRDMRVQYTNCNNNSDCIIENSFAQANPS